MEMTRLNPGDFLDPTTDSIAKPLGATPPRGLQDSVGGGGGDYGGGGLGGGSGSGSAGSSSGSKSNPSRRGAKFGGSKSIISGSSSGRSNPGGYGGYPGSISSREYLGKTGGGAQIDLKKYLPGSKTRGLAGAVQKKMEKAGVTSSNGLTNWEKVRIRYMEQRKKDSFINKP